jgi:hypothetical protein
LLVLRWRLVLRRLLVLRKWRRDLAILRELGGLLRLFLWQLRRHRGLLVQRILLILLSLFVHNHF